jgi:hypothetical protein
VTAEDTVAPEVFPGLPETLTAKEKRHYRMGWAASGRDHPEQLDHYEPRYFAKYGDELHAIWLAGYLDYAAGREFAHTPNCADHASAACELG